MTRISSFDKLLSLEFVVISRLSKLSKEEIRVMLELDDYRKSRFYQEARQDGIDEGKLEGEAKGKMEMLRENISRSLRRSSNRSRRESMVRSVLCLCRKWTSVF